MPAAGESPPPEVQTMMLLGRDRSRHTGHR